MLLPKKVKFRKWHTMRRNVKKVHTETRGIKLSFGSFGLKAMTIGRVRSNQIESARKVVSRSRLEESLYSWDSDVESNTVEVHIHHLRKKLDLIESLTPVDKISFLESVPKYAKLNIPKVPRKLFGDILTLFRQVYKLYHSEAVVLIYFNKELSIVSS